ncbi:MAG: aminomethyl-transferring glycine dehydrogenase subunit GcvPB [Erysipelotrichales bacterium]|nr:aminomethyl-transferring glycine dehydrogenase subunit GcvPB [Erysipelotrichales bacterium]MBQ1385660.1 aminomethyl-transferring glycine dehydrogenase subunit GcvPB [Erysipelotrichales bacterium]MBQ2310440.1 aminomethyl-transferring glycine dehydrogenase subunit GcvPB [Erysipelotrichales bacterium]MBQ2479172.1 aminomethyl-transferring glycine dehydrogenase subunit GcvPB [Erysipelotrichales bacterium]MBQ4010986.1 aminomethyl-transferring glycine dehydrogenase subunit GcvPB [Erysipelotrichales
MKTVFERSVPGRHCTILPACDVPERKPEETRTAPLRLPELSETDLSRHYTELAGQTFGVNDGFYPLGSCTMKYNPKINEEIAGLEGFAKIHPTQENAQGCLKAIYLAEKYFTEITGMDAMTFEPAAGAHGELTGLMLIKRYHELTGHPERNEIIVPDTAHGTNPASSSMCGFKVINIASAEDGCVDLEKLEAVCGEHTAGLMLTNPNTLGIFDKNILDITRIVHKAGGLCYYDGANLNPVMGIARPGDMGFDCIHLNLHKSFSTPHGGGGPGSGPVGCKALLADYLPGRRVVKDGDVYRYTEEKPESIGKVRSFHGNFLVMIKALTYVLTLGKEGIPEVAKNAVLNANYIKSLLEDTYDVFRKGTCMHEFVLTLERLKKETGVSALDVAKALQDYDMHPPTMYFPINVHEALMIEPTETESKETLDKAAAAYLEIYRKAYEDPEYLHNAPHRSPIGRPDEVGAARHPKVKYDFEG